MFKDSKLELNEAFRTSSRFVKNIYLNNGEEIKLILEDTAGQERFRSITEKYFKNSDCIVIGFDVTSRRTFESVVGYWNSAIEEYNCLKYLIGNKIDLYDKRQVSDEEIMKFAEDNNLKCFLTSCLTGEGVQNFFDDLVNEIPKRREIIYY